MSPIEKILLIVFILATLVAAFFATRRLVRLIGAGRGKADWKLAWKRLVNVTARVVTFQPVFRFRFWSSLMHALVGWGFGFYLLVNLVDLVAIYVPKFVLPGAVGDVYRILADLLTVGVLVGMVYFLVRRFVFKPAVLMARDSVLLSAKARHGIRRDSAIVGSFILLHVGARFFGASFEVAAGGADRWQPFASLLARAWSGMSPAALATAHDVTLWLSLGTILLFIPYFPYSKHIHLFFAPLNFLLKPERRSIGELSYINLEDTSIEQFGAGKLADLGWEQLMDSYACIMCYRCQEVCPAYQTGKVLSPAALEINKRYLLNEAKSSLPDGKLVGTVISEEAVWACTSCGACVDICPVGNEPMRDILDIRRDLALMENAFPKQLESAFRGMERAQNPWNVPAGERLKWAEGLAVPTVRQNPTPELLWWVGCAPATDPRAQKTARAFAKILLAAKVNFAVLGEDEHCTGDAARRAGREDLFFGLAMENVAVLNEVKPARIVTTCPHCLHTLKNEYPAFGGNYTVIHHSELIQELIAAGKLPLPAAAGQAVAFHDPCYLGRQNGVLEAPRQALHGAGVEVIEMPRHGAKSFCCGAGGAQAWKEEEPGTERVNAARMKEAIATGAKTVAVGCPFCLTMMVDAAKEQPGMEVKDLAELVADKLP